MDGAAKNGHLNVLSGYMPIEVKAAPPMDEAAMNQFWDVEEGGTAATMTAYVSHGDIELVPLCRATVL
ncbi:hypothetical protein F443_00586 [Phytophthora nicotianae P1569]|uniref:Uncharacterized protein n=2 Tax=Phytophthora nicotianae TaxID=4792 RepID=V9G1Y7_PHYNI|nr:hypothetical protein F443_00586 [Phytophthora nicotianae P1569]